MDATLVTHRFARLAAIITAGLVASACSTPKPNTALELIQHQQEQRALQRRAEAAESRKLQPTKAEMLLNLARDAQREQRYYAVVAYSRQYIRSYGHAPELDALYANGLMETGQTAQSRALYQSLTHTALAARAYHGLGLLAARSRQHAQAVKDLSKAVALQPANPVFLSDLGYAQLLAGDLDNASLSLGQAAELAPDDTKTLSNMALLLLLRDQPTTAAALIRKAGLPDEVRTRIYALAAELRQSQAVRTPAVSAVPSNQASANDTAGMTGRPSQPSIIAASPPLTHRRLVQ